MSIIRADSLKDRAGVGSPDCPNGLTVTGISTIAGDVGINEKIFHNGDANTAFRFPGNDQIKLETSGSSRIHLDANGDINLGNALITERYVHDSGGGIQSDYTHDIITYGLFYYGVTAAANTFTFNLRGNSSTTLNSIMSTSTSFAFTLMHATTNTSRYMTAFKIDGTTQSVKWNGGSAPASAGASGVDVYSFQILKSAANTYTVLGNYANFA